MITRTAYPCLESKYVGVEADMMNKQIHMALHIDKSDKRTIKKKIYIM